MSEGKYLSELHSGEEAEERYDQDYYDNVDKMKARHRDNGKSLVGTTIRCAFCGRRILKKTYLTQFCSNKGKGNCKDAYHNNTNDKRRYRAILKSRGKALWKDIMWEDYFYGSEEEDG